MRVHLGGWQRLGIVASVLWAISAGVVAREADLRRAEGAMNFAYRVCSENAEPEHDYDFSKCQKESEKTYEVFLQHSWASGAGCEAASLPPSDGVIPHFFPCVEGLSAAIVTRRHTYPYPVSHLGH